MINNSLSRRAVLAGGLAALGAAGLAACGPSNAGGGTPTAGAGAGKLVPPTYVPFPGVTPDLPGTDKGVSPAFLKFPNPPVQREGFPLPQTEPVTGLFEGAVPQIAPDQNPAYEVFRKSAGNTMEATVITSALYLDKFQVTMASNSIPDFVQIARVPQYPALLEKYFTDLSDVLGGDGVKKYPGLANIPTETWRIPTVNGKLWGISQPRPPANRILSTRGDILAAKGVDPNPVINNGAELLELLTTLTDKAKGQFAIGALPTTWMLDFVLEMLEGPNVWRVTNGNWEHQNASEEMKEALNEVGKIWKAGVIHPNAFAEPASNITWWQSGVTALYRQGFTGWGVYARANPTWNIGYVRLPKWNGGGPSPIFKTVAGYNAFIAIKKQASDKRLEELLRIADFVASPFGTQQYLDVNYGKEGSTFEFKDGNPVFKDKGGLNVVGGWPYMGGNNQAILFTPGQEELTKQMHAYMTEVMPTAIDNPAQGLYSETDASKSATMNKELADVQRSVIVGEKPMSAWDDFVKKWKSNIGDKMAAEYAEAAAKQ